MFSPCPLVYNRPKQWPKGSIPRVLARGQLPIEELAWDIAAGGVLLTVTSGRDQNITVRLPAGLKVASFKGAGGVRVVDSRPEGGTCALELAAGRPARLEAAIQRVP